MTLPETPTEIYIIASAEGWDEIDWQNYETNRLRSILHKIREGD